MLFRSADPLNLAGIITPGHKVAGLAAHRILLRDGVPLASLEAGEVVELHPAARELGTQLQRRLEGPALGVPLAQTGSGRVLQ